MNTHRTTIKRGLRRAVRAAAIALAFATHVGASGSKPRENGAADYQKTAALFTSKCAKCHTIGQGDRVGPDLKGVAQRRGRDGLIGFILKPGDYLDADEANRALVKKFGGVRMEDLGLSLAQAQALADYLESSSVVPAAAARAASAAEDRGYDRLAMPEEGLAVPAPMAGLLAIVLLGAGVFWRFGWRGSALSVGILAVGLGYWTFGGRRKHLLLGNQQGYEPVQPLEFSHARHAGDLEIACLNCHHGAEKSDVAGVPSVNICMNCHKTIRGPWGSDRRSPEIAKLERYWESGKSSAAASIPWVRVHDLPDFVHFSHWAHVNNRIRCQECHGPVQTMKRMRQASSLSMGWCINCHRKAAGSVPTHWKSAGGSLDCAACHW